MRSRASKSVLADAEFEKLFRDEFLLTGEQAAVWLGVSVSTLNHWRSDGLGPQFVKLCGTARGAVRYRVGDIRLWLSKRVVSSASEAMMLDTHARVSGDVTDWDALHPFIVKPHFVVDSVFADTRTLAEAMSDPYVELHWMTPASALRMPWLRSEHRVELLGKYLNCAAGAGQLAVLETVYALALAQVPEHLYGSHPDLTLQSLGEWAGGGYPVEFGGGS